MLYELPSALADGFVEICFIGFSQTSENYQSSFVL